MAKDSCMVIKKLFIKKLEKNFKKTNDRIDAYLRDPNETNIHDSRIAIRRLIASYGLLPKFIRKKQKLKNYIGKCKLFFKINTKIRDYDIINRKLINYDPNSVSYLKESLKTQRQLKLRDAKKIGYGIQKIRQPQINTERISESKLDKRFKKIMNTLNAQIEQNIPIVLNDERKIPELHKLRKDFKKLRYSLELLPDTKNMSNMIINLKEIQDMLGEIHDSDIAIDYLKTIGNSHNFDNILEYEKVQRTQKYHAFVQSFKKNEFYLKLV